MIKSKNLAAFAMAATLCAGIALPAVASTANPAPTTSPRSSSTTNSNPNTATTNGSGSTATANRPSSTATTGGSNSTATNGASSTATTGGSNSTATNGSGSTATTGGSRSTATTSGSASSATADSSATNSANRVGNMISLERAMSIAKAQTPGNIIKGEIRQDFGQLVYRINLVNSEGRRVETNINAQTAEVESSSDHHYNNDRGERVMAMNDGAAQAIQAVTDRYPNAYIREIELEEDDNEMVYEVMLYDDEGLEREIRVNATNGNIVQDELDDDDADRSQVNITREEAERRALAEEPGTVIYAYLDDDSYVVNVLNGDGNVYSVHIDAENGDVERSRRELLYLSN